jgi:hypothetical protein
MIGRVLPDTLTVMESILRQLPVRSFNREAARTRERFNSTRRIKEGNWICPSEHSDRVLKKTGVRTIEEHIQKRRGDAPCSIKRSLWREELLRTLGDTLANNGNEEHCS